MIEFNEICLPLCYVCKNHSVLWHKQFWSCRKIIPSVFQMNDNKSHKFLPFSACVCYSLCAKQCCKTKNKMKLKYMWKKISFVWNKGAVECFEHVYRYILYKDQGVEFESYCHDSNDDTTTTAKGNAMEMVELHRILYKALVFFDFRSLVFLAAWMKTKSKLDVKGCHICLISRIHSVAWSTFSTTFITRQYIIAQFDGYDWKIIWIE